MKKILYIGIPAAIIIALNVIYGSVISWFLSIAIIACLLFYVGKLGIENIINTRLQQYKQGDERIGKMVAFNNKWRSVINFLLLTVVFLSGVFAVYFTMNPHSKNAWFLNNEYYGLSNSAVAFKKSLNVFPLLSDSSNQQSKITISSTNNQASITFNHFFQPVIATDEEQNTRLLNNIFSEKITSNLALADAQNKIDINIKEEENGFFKRLFGADDETVTYTVALQSNDQEILEQYNLTAPYSDNITITSKPLQKGMSVFDLFLDNTTFSAQKNETYQVLESILLQLGNTYLIANIENGQRSLKLFPGYEMYKNGFRFYINNQLQNAQLNNTATLPFEQKFYIGFNNSKKLLHIGNVAISEYNTSSKANTALVFDYANTYMLKSPGVQQKGDKSIRFITNNFDKVITDNLKEGFYFTTYNLRVAEAIDGNIDYISGGAYTPLAIAVTDNNRAGKHQTINNNKFSLSSQNGDVAYLFDIRDFSANGFSPDNTVLYLGIIYIAFVLLAVFFPGKKIDRLEPIILVVIFVLAALRFILYWRVATFPPLENITKHELENTLINFDFNMGMKLPVPLTLIWILLFVLGIIIYRVFVNKKGDFNLAEKLKWSLSSPKTLNKYYAIFIGICLFLFLLNKKILHVEFLTRIISIIIPLVGYWYFSKQSNRNFIYQPLTISGEKSKWKIQLKAYLYYIFNNPTFIITCLTILFFAIADRGFAILFTLFILLKNIFINFLKKPLDRNNNSLKRMLYKPNNYWIYGFLALVVYLITLCFKPLFYYLLTYKLIVVFVVLLLAVVIIYVLYPQQKKAWTTAAIVAVVWALLIAIPFTRSFIDHKMNDVVKHVQYRASLIHQPISDLLQQNEYASFKTRKIIETAENQWFINSYISKNYDNNNTINLRPHSRVGVDYPTQTRDVVIARYVISELGNFVMYLLLLLILLPMILYLISYRFHLATSSKSNSDRDIGSYAGLIPLLIVFTLSLFVWLTATNRFVFFGQDFPFLSLTSKVSVLLPLILYALTLTQLPTLQQSYKINLQNNAIKYLFFVALIAAFALTTIQKNELNNKNFSVVMDTTKKHIDVDLNAILASIQDSLDNKNKRFTYAQMISILGKDHRFDSLKNNVVKDPYTKSILENLIDKPSSAFQLNNPLFVVYDNGRYAALYNKNLYLELPPVESRQIWNGNVSESLLFNDVTTALVNYNNEFKNVALPYFINDPNSNIQFALMPGSWFANANNENVGIVNVSNSSKGRSHIFVYKNAKKNLEQNATSFVSTLQNEDLATIYNNDKSFTLGFRNAGNRYALNKWINGEYKIVYPMKENNFWIYNFANALRTAYSNPENLNKNVKITLDYELSKNIQTTVSQSGKAISAKNRRYNFSVIGADGDGNVRFMSDFVTNRSILDPNNEAAIYALQRQQFFFSNAKNERDQWGDRNLLNLYLGPGSSIKPLTTAVITSQLNAGWERLLMKSTSVPELDNYAGLKLVKPWKNDEHYFGTFGIAKFLEFSSNYYQSVMMFLGSYSREYFLKDNRYSLANLLSTKAGSNNSFPTLEFNGTAYFLPNFESRKGNWPATDKGKTNNTFFGNENALIAMGLEQNVNLRTKDKDKNDHQITSTDRVNFVDSTLFNVLDKNRSGGYLWSFPEQSYYLQSERAFPEIHQNFNLGLKTATLGGYPYRLTPYMMLQMYMSMFAQDRNFALKIIHQDLPKNRWQVDSTWEGDANYRTFLANYIFKGMEDVIFGANGTAKLISGQKAKHPGYYFYAKTGTINEQTSNVKSSRRLVVVVSNKDMTSVQNIGNAKIYAWYFAVDNTGNFDPALINNIIDQTMASKSFNYYFR